MRIAAVSLLLAAALGGACAEGSPPSSGLHGVVVRGPTQPVCRAGERCEEPAAGVTLSFVRNGRSTRVRTNARGEYRVRLAPGTYAIRTDSRPFGLIPSPGSARVAANRFKRLDLAIDTGIR